MRRYMFHIVATAAASSALSFWPSPANAQTPTYAPNSPLVAPGDPVYRPDSTIPGNPVPQPISPQSTIPQTTVPGSTVPMNPVPDGNYSGSGYGNGYSVPSGNTFDPPATIVTPGSVAPNPGYGRGWYPGYWLGVRPYDPPFGGGGAVRYQANYQGYGGAPYGAPGMGGGCNTCQPAMPSPCGSQNIDYGRGYDGFMTGW